MCEWGGVWMDGGWMHEQNLVDGWVGESDGWANVGGWIEKGAKLGLRG